MTQEERIELAAIVKDAVKPLSDEIAEMRGDIAELKQGQTRIELKIENEVDRSIQVLGEGHSITNRKLDEKIGLENRVETLEHKVSAVEYALRQAK